MKKVIFEGSINGKTFDNVSDYNKEMTSLLRNGTSITASSNTRVVDEPEDSKRNPRDVEVARRFDAKEFLPFFNDESDEHYLDALMNDDGDYDKFRIDSTLDNTFAKLKQLVSDKNISLEDSFNFINNLKEIRSNVDKDAKLNKATLEEIAESIDKLSEKMRLINNANPVIESISNYYNKAFSLMREYLLKF